MSTDAEKAETGAEYEDVLGTGILVEKGGGVVTDGVEGGKGRQQAGRPVLMSRAMRDFAGLDQVSSSFLRWSLVLSRYNVILIFGCLTRHEIACFERGQREVSQSGNGYIDKVHRPPTMFECKRPNNR